ncbi:SGNH/GDSL hydrolase family protein [Fulvivirga sedimenti]|uniref:SGNH/GDSL hydrolase family protein n=1 Tax=Fulvivirga sedimenti TaxID=2879465 RepID=A0A9X1L249_9BACT|nr:hypothetical protein [Fulvivirga sedimenti]MCA6078932.1 hypothetical protein [Fulvivirga sedimenti]
MNKRRIYLLGITFVCLLLSANFAFSQAEEGHPIRVLFVGNSFTYYYNLPQVVSAMAKTQGLEIITRQSTVGGSNLEEHWKEQKGTRTRRLLDSLEWDYVVLNNHSRSTIDTPDEFSEYGKKFVDLIRSKGAEPVFMQTWGYKSNPLMIRTIIPKYAELSAQTGSYLVPGGELFMEARKWRPDLEMFQDDKHPSPNGTYMLGLAFYKFFTGRSTEAIPPRLTTLDQDGEKTYLMFMTPEDADFLQQLVDDFEFNTLKSGE